MDGVESAYEFAGQIGINPSGLTLRQLWRMASGLAKQRRVESLQLIYLAFNGEIDIPHFLRTGQLAETIVGKPLELGPELEAKVQAEIDRIRRENPNLPKFASQQ